MTSPSQRSTVNGRLTRHTFLARSFIPCLNFDAKETNVQTNILTKYRAIVNHKQFQVFYDHLHWCFIEKTLDQRSIRLLTYSLLESPNQRDDGRHIIHG